MTFFSQFLALICDNTNYGSITVLPSSVLHTYLANHLRQCLQR